MKYVKYISRYEVEEAPKNYNGILNFDTNVEAMKAAGFLPLIKGERPVDDTLFTVSYQISTNAIEEVIILETEEHKAQRKRLELDQLTLTPADVERALLKAKNMDFDDLKALIQEEMTGINMKALNVEFRASLFYRGATFGGGRLFDTIGALLGYTSEDMDTLFLTKELPAEEEES